MVNQNRASNSEGALNCIKYQEVVFEGMQYSSPGFGSDDNPLTAEIAWLLRLANKERTKYEGAYFAYRLLASCHRRLSTRPALFEHSDTLLCFVLQAISLVQSTSLFMTPLMSLLESQSLSCEV